MSTQAVAGNRRVPSPYGHFRSEFDPEEIDILRASEIEKWNVSEVVAYFRSESPHNLAMLNERAHDHYLAHPADFKKEWVGLKVVFLETLSLVQHVGWNVKYLLLDDQNHLASGDIPCQNSLLKNDFSKDVAFAVIYDR